MVPSPVENPTLIERFVLLIPLPYPVAAMFWSIVLGGPGFYIVQSFTGGAPSPTFNVLFNTFLNFLLPFYTLLVVRYMRLRIVAMEKPIASGLAGGEEDYHRTFGRVTQSGPVLAVTVLMGVLIWGLFIVSRVLPPTPLLLALNIVVDILNLLAFSTYI